MPAIEILIADDHGSFRRNLRSLLESRSKWRVCGEAADGEEAVEKTKQLRPHVVLMDLSMPKMDGSEATRIIREKTPESKVIIVSQNDPEVLRQQARELGAVAWVAKNSLATDLIPTIQETISHRNRDDARETNPSQGVLFVGGGEMGERIRSFDWSKTVLGPIDRWSESLKTAVRICIGSRNPTVLWWGRRDLSQLYNDAYISFLGDRKHPAFFGGSGRECWSETWETMGPMLEEVFTTGEARCSEDFLWVLNRNLPREEGYFSFSYSPIWNDAGRVEGIFCAYYETTARVIGDRRLRTLRDLGRIVSTAKTAEEACASAASILEDNPADIPFALFYLLENEPSRARLAATSGFAGEREAAPELIDLASTATISAWPLRQVLDTGEAEFVSDLSNRFSRLPGGAWPESPENALVAPIASAGQSRPAGFLVVGVSPRRIVDGDYHGFFDLIVGHVSTAIANARAYEEERKRAEAHSRIEEALRHSQEQCRKLSETLDTEVRARTQQLEERNREVLRQSDRVRALSWRLLRAQDEERRHISRELHDSAGQTLAVLGMNLAQFAQKTGQTAPELANQAEGIQEMVQQLHREIRTTSYLLHPPLLDQVGLYSALSWYTQGLRARSGLEIKLHISPDFGRLPQDMELAVFRLVQECLTNIHRHSGSKTASVRIAREESQITVNIQDKGHGMSPERLSEVQSGPSGVGIAGMRERLRQFEGEMKIESDTGGTRIFITIPASKAMRSEGDRTVEPVKTPS